MNWKRWVVMNRRMLRLGILGLLLTGTGLASADQKLYWSDIDFPPGIQRSDIDGSNVETIIQQLAPVGRVRGMELDAAAGKIYWADHSARAIKRANRNGSNIEILVPGLNQPWGAPDG